MNTKQIEIDLEVYKTLEALRESFDESYNDILLRALPSVDKNHKNHQKGGLYIRDGVTLRTGTQLRHIAKRLGEQYQAVVQDGGIEFDGRVFHSPSKAAIAATNTNRNGWTFWEYYDADLNQWRLLDELRESGD